MFELRLLGPLSLTGDDGSPVHSVLAQPKRAALLAYLVAARPRGPQSRDRVLALFWPEADCERARNALKQSVFHLRRSLGDEMIESTATSLGVPESHLWCDATAFVQACERGEWEEALALYQGHLLDGFHVDGALDLDEWIEDERRRLRAMAADAAGRLADAVEADGDLPGALHWARCATEFAPYDETRVRRLIGLLDRVGDRAGAVSAYTDFARRLAEEMEVEPSADTQAMIEEVRSRSETGLRSVSAAVAEPEPATSSREERLTAPGLESAPSARHHSRWVAAGLVGLAASVAAMLLPAAESNADLVPNRVLVATLENRTGDAKLDVVGSMAADWITQGLQHTGLVEVIDPTTAYFNTRAVASDTLPLTGLQRARAAAGATRSGIVVWGAFYRRGDSLQFHAQITDAGKGKLLRTLQPVSAPSADPAAAVQKLPQHVAGALAATLDERLASLSPPSSAPPTFEAYQAYVAGLDIFTRGDDAGAAVQFEQAVALDSSFMLPRFWRIFALGNSGQSAKRDSAIRALIPLRERLGPLDRHSVDFFVAHMNGDRRAALASARAAAKLAPQSNWTYMVASLSQLEGRPREALEALEQLDPERGWVQGWDAYWSVRSLSRHLLGQHEQELVELRHARSRDPKSPTLLRNELVALAALGRVAEIPPLQAELFEMLRKKSLPKEVITWPGTEFYAHGDSRNAYRYYQRTLALLDSLPADEGNTPEWRAVRGVTLYNTGRLHEAESIFVELATEQPEQLNHRGYLGSIAARRGNRTDAERVMRWIEEQQSRQPRLAGAGYHRRARIAALLGNRDQAVLLSRRALAEGGVRQSFLHDVDMQSLRAYAPYRDLVGPLD